MQVTQAKHIVSTKVQSPPLYGTGAEKTLAHIIGSDFIAKAKQDGYVESIDEKNELMVLKYKDGTHDIIDLSTRSDKNSNGGFYISNQKVTTYKEGDKFKRNDIIAKNERFFKDVNEATSFMQGRLTKVAITPMSTTYEDGTAVTSQLTDDMSTKITMNKPIAIGPNANVEFLIKKGQEIKAGDPLIIFEESFDDADINKFLDKIGKDFNETIKDLSKNKIASKYTGKIVGIDLYYNLPIEDFSPSLQKIIKSYNKAVEAKNQLIKKYETNGEAFDIILPPSNQVDVDKIKGNVFQGLLIDVYIEHDDNLWIGDKLSFQTSLKAIVSEVIDEKLAPYSEFNKEEHVQALMSPLSPLNRMTADGLSMMFMSKFILGLKQRVKEEYEK